MTQPSHAETDLAALSALPQAAFVARLGAVFEHSPWIAGRAWAARPFASVEALHAAMVAAVAALLYALDDDGLFAGRHGLPA